MSIPKRPEINGLTLTKQQILKAIPEHCFDRSLFWSFYYYIASCIGVIVLYVYACVLLKNETKWNDVVLYGVLWPIYWYWQGAILTGLWVIAHECGHQAFSRYQIINDTVGFVTHSLLLVPYFSWKFTHNRHHVNTGSMEHDEVHLPISKEVAKLTIRNTYIGKCVYLLGQSTVGWYLYLFFNASSQIQFANHFNPFSSIFRRNERMFVVLSDIGCIGALCILFLLQKHFGWIWLIKTYVIPLLVVNFWLVTITYLQHTHPNIPRYASTKWERLRGALATVDRDYGLLNYLHHNIGNTHVLHHIFSKIPHYHAKEATKAIKEVLGEYYLFDKRNVFQALWEEVNVCEYVLEDSKLENKGVFWFYGSREGKDVPSSQLIDEIHNNGNKDD